MAVVMIMLFTTELNKNKSTMPMTGQGTVAGEAEGQWIIVSPVRALAEPGLARVLAAAFVIKLAFRVDETRVFEEKYRFA